MPAENQECKLPLQPPSTGDSKKKRKKKKTKRKRAAASASPPGNTRDEKPRAASLHPETSSPVSLLPHQSPGPPGRQLPNLRAAGGKGGEQLAGRGWRSRKHPKDSPAPLTATDNSGGAAAVSELSTQARESLRWEGALDDPRAEEERLELYRANRRQRYIAHREALFKESQPALRRTFTKESAEKLDPD